MASLEKIKQGPNFIVYKSGDQKLIKIENVIASYPHFGKKRVDTDEQGNTKENWGGVALLNKETHAEAKKAFDELMKELMVANDVKIPAEFRCLKDGDERDDEHSQGHWTISFSDSNRRPAVRDQRAALMTDESAIDDKFYGGCVISVLLRPWYFNGQAKGKSKSYPKRICCGFTGVQYIGEGKRFGTGHIDDSDAWGDESGNAGNSKSSDGDDDFDL